MKQWFSPLFWRPRPSVHLGQPEALAQQEVGAVALSAALLKAGLLLRAVKSCFSLDERECAFDPALQDKTALAWVSA